MIISIDETADMIRPKMKAKTAYYQQQMKNMEIENVARYTTRTANLDYETWCWKHMQFPKNL